MRKLHSRRRQLFANATIAGLARRLVAVRRRTVLVVPIVHSQDASAGFAAAFMMPGHHAVGEHVVAVIAPLARAAAGGGALEDQRRHRLTALRLTPPRGQPQWAFPNDRKHDARRRRQLVQRPQQLVLGHSFSARLAFSRPVRGSMAMSPALPFGDSVRRRSRCKPVALQPRADARDEAIADLLALQLAGDRLEERAAIG